MWMGKQLKKNKGSALTIVLFMLFMLSVMAIAVIALTGSELGMSVMTSDRSKAMQYAQAGAEKAAQIIDGIVAQAQEDARTEASKEVQDRIQNFKSTDPISNEPVDITAPFIGVIDNSDINDLKILDKDELNEIYENEFKYWFNKEIDKQFKNFSLPGGNVENGSFTCSNFSIQESTISVNRDLYPLQPSFKPLNLIKITSTGEFKSPATGSTYKRGITAEFEILFDQIPKQIGYMTKVRVNKNDQYPSILSDKALIAEKNILSIGGMVRVNKGNVVSCGTVPKAVVDVKVIENGITVNKEIEVIDYNADSYAFGGIIAGMISSNNNSVHKFWEDPNLGLGIIDGLKDNTNSLAIELGINNVDNYVNNNYRGSFDVDGNVGTLSYLHTLYSSNGGSPDIKVNGNVFARSAVVESQANYSEIFLQNLYTYDDLRINANNSRVEIGGQGGIEGKLVGLTKNDIFVKDKISSSVIVAGDSNLDINGSVYIGGSSAYNDYNNSDGKFISGVSIQKSDDRPAAAFEKDANIKHNKDNNFYVYDNSNDVYSSHLQSNINWVFYKDPYNKSVQMMDGKINQNNDKFNIIERAMHLKYIWNLWNNDVEYASYFNTGDITITEEAGKLKGFCYGGVAANNTFYGPYTGFLENEAGYDKQEKYGKPEYAKLMDLFIEDTSDEIYLNVPNFSDPTKKLKKLSDSVNNTVFTDSIFYSDSNDKFMYYGNGNVVLTNSSITDGTTTKNFAGGSGSGSGIVYAKGDIYVKDGTNFTGILIAEGNIVFFGSATITYDKSVVDELITNGDPNIGRFFKHTATDVIMNDNNAIIQTINKKNVKYIKVVSWKETDM